MRAIVLLMALLLSVAFPVSAVAGGKGGAISSRGWHGGNAQALSRMIAEHGKASAGYDPSHPPVAAFDWDNTVIKNDVGDAVMFWMLGNNKILQPPKRDWRTTSPLLSDDAVAALGKVCASQGEPGKPLATGGTDAKSVACADEILAIYDGGKTTAGAKAWKVGAQSDTMEPAYAWTVALEAGSTLAEIKSFAEQAIAFNLANAIGAVQRIGSRKDVAAWIRIYEPMRELVAALQAGGFDVRVISASAQPLVEAFAARVGIVADHVIGVRAVLDRKGKATAVFQGCGSHAEGNFGLITYKQGKRCWLNKVLFGTTTADAQMNDPSPLLFAAGDSDTDLHFLKDARYRLVLNRNKTELMCHAYAGRGKVASADGLWLVNPMFIEPKPRKAEPYDCSQHGLPNQTDAVY